MCILTDCVWRLQVIESLVVAMLVDRGLLSYSDPICKHWESFCTSAPDEDGRRAAVTVAHLMRHQAGLAAPRAPLTWSKLSNPAVLARQVWLRWRRRHASWWGVADSMCGPRCGVCVRTCSPWSGIPVTTGRGTTPSHEDSTCSSS